MTDLLLTDVERSRLWADDYNEAAMLICARHLLRLSDRVEDIAEACDVVTVNVKPMAISLRVRRPGYADAYPYDFSIRSWRASGAMTELEKITTGFCDWFFYGHANPLSVSIGRWFLIDCEALRRYWAMHPSWRENSHFREIQNTDGTSAFRAFDLRRLPPDVVIASSHRIPREDEL